MPLLIFIGFEIVAILAAFILRGVLLKKLGEGEN